MYLGIDLGTSAVKAVIADAAGVLVAEASAPLVVSSPSAGWSEQNPSDWWEATKTCLREIAVRHVDQWKAVSAIGLSGQMHGAVLLDKAHRPLRPAILWNDGRSMSQCNLLADSMPDIATISGAQPMPGFTAPKLMWLHENESEIHSNIAHVLLPKDYIRLQLTGSLATDMADAAGTMWLDEAKRVWSQEICAATDTDPDWLPVLLEGPEISGNLLSSVTKELGLPVGLPVAAGGGDAAAGAVGIGAIEAGDAFISLGTSGQLFVCSDQYRHAEKGALHSYAHCVPQRWFQMAAMLNGASPFAWFSGITNIAVADLLVEVEVPGTSAIPVFLPYLSGERTPHNNPSVRGSFYGLTGNTTRADMTRAVVHAIAYSFCDAHDAMADAGTTIEKPSAIGGGARSDYVLQTMSDAMGIPICRQVGAPSGPALGAALLAGVASDGMSLSDLTRKPSTERVFEPQPGMADYHAPRLETYRALYRALKPLANPS